MPIMGDVETIVDQAVTADMTSGKFSTKDVTMLAVEVAISAWSGTTPAIHAWLQGSLDGVNWVDVPADFVNTTADNATEGTTTANKRDIVDGGTVTAAVIAMGVYKHWPFNWGRFKCKVTGTTPSLTTKARVSGK